MGVAKPLVFGWDCPMCATQITYWSALHGDLYAMRMVQHLREDHVQDHVDELNESLEGVL